MKRFAFIAIFLLAVCIGLSAQTTKVRGRVTDADSGEGIPFVGVYFKGTTIGISTDIDGYYAIETKDQSVSLLCAQILGYDSAEQQIKPGTFTQADFRLKLTDNRLSGAVVKADNRKVKRLLANIDAARDRNNPERRPFYTTDIYNKIELDLTHPKEQIKNKRVLRECGFVFDYMDTSSVSGVPYLPIMLSESSVERRHILSPSSDNETVKANRISGVNPDNNLLTQFTGSLLMKANFYEPFINTFGVEFPSPTQNAGLLYYNYFIIDSLQVDGRKTYQVRYHPKDVIASPALDGEMMIDAEDYAIRSIHAKMVHGGNVNWLRDIAFDAEYQKLGDSLWFYKSDRLYADFSIALRDSSKMMSFLGHREMTYSKVKFDPIAPPDKSDGQVAVDPESNHFDENYWASVRPHELSEKEKDIYVMVDKIKDTPIYRDVYSVVYTLINGYWELGNVGIGPYTKLISFNNVEGFRPQFGFRTSRDWSKKHRFAGYLAYGCKDETFKGGLSYELMLRRDRTRKFTFDAHYDMFQLGRSQSKYSDGNILASVFGKGRHKMCPVADFSARYEHEFNLGFNLTADAGMRRFYANAYVPMVTPDGEILRSIASNELHLATRFSWNETVNRGYFDKIYVLTKYPVVQFDFTGGIPGIRSGDCGFFRPELTVDWRVRIPPLGLSRFHLNAGTIFGTVPYPLLHLHEGNGSYILDKKAFSCMDYFEFASDTWATLFWNHCFYGFFLGKIPLLRRLQLREEFTFKMAYGTLSDKNDGSLALTSAPLRFPAGMREMGTPYMEIGAGVSNILRLFRVDFIWRLTHLEECSHPFAVNVGLEFRF